jgi:branched-subunit amino acid ABC-type transport system permease component/ABC-type branched-subunit amino acid transport system ATPase component
MIELLSLVVAGAVAGGLYAVMASGLVLTYQASGVFNFGYGAMAYTSALAYHVLHQPAEEGGLGLAIVPAALIAIGVVGPLLGWALDVLLFRRLAGAPEVPRLVGTIGVLVALPAAALLVVEVVNAAFGAEWPTGAGDQGLAPPGLGPSPPVSWTITRGVTVSSDQVAVLVAAALSAFGLWVLLRHTRLGLETRAGVDRADLARLRGIDTARSSRIVWILASGLAGLAGVLIAPLFDLNPLTFDMIVFTSFTAVVFARMRSLPLAFVGGVALGVVQNLVNGYAPDALADISGFRTSVPFILLFVLLFFLPRTGRQAGSVAEEAPAPDPRADLPVWRRRLPWAVAGLVLSAWVLLVSDAYWNGIVNRGLALALVFLSFVVVTGIGGMINLAQATFVTVGGFTAGWLVNHQWPSTVPVIMDNGRIVFWLAALLAAVVALGVGLLVALPSLRFGGLTLALATLALAFIGDRLVFQLDGVRNGSRGWSIPRPEYGPIDLGDDKVLFVVLLVLVVAVVGLVGNMRSSATGRSVLALRSSEVAAATSGVAPVRVKLTLFAVSAGLAGFAGALYAMVTSPITNTSAPPLLGIVWLAVAVTFGIRRPGGAVVAGVVFAMVPAVLDGIGGTWEGQPWGSLPDGVRDVVGSAELASLLFGLGAIGLAQEPEGVLAQVGTARRERRRRRAEEAVASPAVEVREPRREPRERLDAVSGPTAAPALTLDGVHAGYGEVEVLHGVDLVVPEGSVVCVVGANGAGKSTLAGVAAGLVDARSGRVLLGEEDVTASPAHARARAGLLLAPEARGVFPELTVEDNLTVRLRSPEAREAAYERFPVLGERRHQLAGSLSGGEQQQLALVGALVDPPKVVVADEPTLGLSPMATEVVLSALEDLRSAGTALVLVEERAREALRLADEVVVVELGRVAWSGPAADVDLDALTSAYFGSGAAAPGLT